MRSCRWCLTQPAICERIARSAGILVGTVTGMVAALLAGLIPGNAVGSLVIPLVTLAVGLIAGLGARSEGREFDHPAAHALRDVSGADRDLLALRPPRHQGDAAETSKRSSSSGPSFRA